MRKYIVTWQVAFGPNPDRRETQVTATPAALHGFLLAESVARVHWAEGVRPHMVRILGSRPIDD